MPKADISFGNFLNEEFKIQTLNLKSLFWASGCHKITALPSIRIF